jgi:tetratricopeptide (TPR) repeat protein
MTLDNPELTRLEKALFEGYHQTSKILIETEIIVSPNIADYYYHLGCYFYHHAQWQEAILYFLKAGKINYLLDELSTMLSSALIVARQYDHAMMACLRAISLQPEKERPYYSMAALTHQLLQSEKERECLEKLVFLHPHSYDYHSRLGKILYDLAESPRALGSLKCAYILDPSHAHLYCYFMNFFVQERESEQARLFILRAVFISQDHVDYYKNLAILSLQTGYLTDSVVLFKKAIILRPEDSSLYTSMSLALQSISQSELALQLSSLALKIDPDSVETSLIQSQIYISMGNFERGWSLFEKRWAHHIFSKARHYDVKPQWRGESGQGRTLLLYKEGGGYGDVIQNSRFALLALQRGWSVQIQVPENLIRIISTLHPLIKVMSEGQTVDFIDRVCPLGSLPFVVDLRVENLSGTPYLSVDDRLIRHWQKKIQEMDHDKLRIGLVYSGRSHFSDPSFAAQNQRRTIPLIYFRSLFDDSRLQSFILQKDRQAISDLNDFSNRPIDWMDECHDFADTAALMSSLDLILTVDTSVAHLAGAIGRPVWMLDRIDSDCRWLKNYKSPSDTTPWYHSMKIFRQDQERDWSNVIKKVEQSIEKLLEDREHLRHQRQVYD